MLEAAILRTVLYADVFTFALTLAELHTYLISDTTWTLAEVQQALRVSPALQTLLCYEQGYISLAHRGDAIQARRAREALAHPLVTSAQYYGKWLAAVPFVRMVALTGAVAMRNPASPTDDIDYLLVVESGRVWLARALTILVVRWARLWGTELCPNYVLATNRLAQTRTDLYIAHELAQMIPLYGYALYCEMMTANPWAYRLLANTRSRPAPHEPGVPRFKYWLEHLLSGAVGDKLEAWEYQRKARRFQQHRVPAATSATIDAQTVKGHFHDHGVRILQEYEKRLLAYNLM